MATADPVTHPGRQLTVRHGTRYRYSRPIPHSKHCAHVRPIDDAYPRWPARCWAAAFAASSYSTPRNTRSGWSPSATSSRYSPIPS